MQIKTWFFVILLFSSNAFAESVELATGEVLDGKLLEFPKEVTIELSDGTKKTIPYQGISSIFKNNAPQSYSPFLNKEKKEPLGEKASKDVASFSTLDESKGPYSSPIQTFQTWKMAALKDDIDSMSNCYVSYRKSDVKKELKKLSKKTRADMKKAMNETIFTPSEPYYQGEQAIMEVSWTKGLASQTQTLKFALEGNQEWKILE